MRFVKVTQFCAFEDFCSSGMFLNVMLQTAHGWEIKRLCCCSLQITQVVFFLLSDDDKNIIFLPVSITSHHSVLKTSDQELTRSDGFAPISEFICT